MTDDQETKPMPPTAGSSVPPEPASFQLNPGDRVGNYVIREQIGEGGFAIVYAAEQERPVRRKVALKIIKVGMDTKQVIARFEAEKQALAMMDHPNVAKVFDAGATETGRPYFVMEYIAGTPITDYCDRQRLTIEERLGLFNQVCEGVQHAHQKGIIHRDIKPSNVLVAVKEGEPQVKVIDFGVAKAITQRLTEKTIYTEQGQLIGTPEYMSPEQAEMTAEDIDTRSDIYSLGVLLYELLTGALPFDPTTLRQAAFGEIQRIIREDEPPKPSTRLSSLGVDSATSAKRRRTDPKSHVRVVRGDLDWIVMTAMEKDRQRRYRSSTHMAEDIGRYLQDKPIHARPPSLGYQLRKFARRNMATISTGAAILTTILVAAGAIGTALVRAASADRRSETLNLVIEGLMEEMSVEDIVAAASKDIELAASLRLNDAVLSRASIDDLLGKDLLARGQYEEARGILRHVYDLRRDMLGPDHTETLMTLLELGIVSHRLGSYGEAERTYVEAVAGLTRTLGLDDRKTLRARNALAMTYLAAQKLEEALPIFRDVSGRQIEVIGLDHHETVSTLANLAHVLALLGRLNEAESIALETIAIAAGVLDENHPALLDLRINLGLTLAATGRASEAIALVRPALEARIAALGESHPKTINTINTFCTILMDAGELDEAEQCLRRGAEVSAEVFPPGHYLPLLFQVNLGGVLLENGSAAQAVAILADAVPGIAAVLPGRVAGECRIGYGQALAATGELDRAEEELLTAHEELLGSGVKEGEGPAGTAALALATLYEAWGKPDIAAEWRAKLPTEQDAVASDPPGVEKQDE